MIMKIVTTYYVPTRIAQKYLASYKLSMYHVKRKRAARHDRSNRVQILPRETRAKRNIYMTVEMGNVNLRISGLRAGLILSFLFSKCSSHGVNSSRRKSQFPAVTSNTFGRVTDEKLEIFRVSREKPPRLSFEN